MKQYRMFRSDNGGVLLQHPDNPDALADGDTISQALKVMRILEKRNKLEHIQDQLKPILSRV